MRLHVKVIIDIVHEQQNTPTSVRNDNKRRFPKVSDFAEENEPALLNAYRGLILQDLPGLAPRPSIVKGISKCPLKHEAKCICSTLPVLDNGRC